MPHETSLISTIVAGFVLAFVLGALANRLRMPPLVGYLLAGVVVGPFTPGFVANQELALELSEIGIILLMFGVGLHFSLRDLISVQVVAVPGAIGRMIAGTAMGMGVGMFMGWPFFGGLIFGLALSVASTVVLLKSVQDRHLVDTERGRIATGWVIVEDIALVLALVLIPAFATAFGATDVVIADPFLNFVERVSGMELGLWGVLGVTVVKLAAFVGFMLIVGRRLIPWLLHVIAHTGSRELFRLAVLAVALGVAAGSAYLFGVSLALGAFFAGMILSESELSHRAAEETLPLRDAFSVLFFVAVGMLFDPSIFVRSPLEVIATLAIVLVGKSAVAYLIMVLFRRSVSTSLSISASLAQIGDFSFVLASLGISLGLLPAEGRDLILAAAMISIFVNPLLVWAAEHFRPALEARFKAQHPELVQAGARGEPALATAGGAPLPAVIEVEDVRAPTTLEHHTVLIGYGRVGSVVAEGLRAEGRPFVLVEDAKARVREARALGIETIDGNAATSQAMRLANVKAADTVIVAIPNAFEAGQATEQSRKLNAQARIIARAHSDEEEAHLKHLGADGVIMGEREIGMGMLNIVRAVPLPPAATQAAVERALGKALDVGRRGPAGPEYTPPPPSTVTPGARAEIEAALNRALALEAGVVGAGMVAGAGIGPGAPAIAADEAQLSAEVEAEQAAVAAVEDAPVMTLALPTDAVADDALPAAEVSGEEQWLYEPALEAAAAEQQHADELPEDSDAGATAGSEAADGRTGAGEAEAARWAEDLQQEAAPVARPDPWGDEAREPASFAALPGSSGDADVAEAANADEEMPTPPMAADEDWAAPEDAEVAAAEAGEPVEEPADGAQPAAAIEPYPDYWASEVPPADVAPEAADTDVWGSEPGEPAVPETTAPGAPDRPNPPATPDTPPVPDEPDLPPPVPEIPTEVPPSVPDPWWTPVPEQPTPLPPPIHEPDEPPPGPEREVPEPPPVPERGPMPPPGPMEPPQPVASAAEGEPAGEDGDEAEPATDDRPAQVAQGDDEATAEDDVESRPFRMPRPGQGDPAGS